MFAMIKEIRPNSNPQRFSCDYEKAVINAVHGAFPNCELEGCFFHLVKNMKKKVGEEGLMHRYNTDAEFSLKARMISALAFVPIPDLDQAVTELENFLPAELLPVFSYFEDSYIGRPLRGRNGRRPPLFPPTIWNVYDRTVMNLPRTNNHAEAAHRRLQTEFGVGHPTLWKFIEGLWAVQHGRDAFNEGRITNTNIHESPTSQKNFGA